MLYSWDTKSSLQDTIFSMSCFTYNQSAALRMQPPKWACAQWSFMSSECNSLKRLPSYFQERLKFYREESMKFSRGTDPVYLKESKE